MSASLSSDDEIDSRTARLLKRLFDSGSSSRLSQCSLNCGAVDMRRAYRAFSRQDRWSGKLSVGRARHTITLARNALNDRNSKNEGINCAMLEGFRFRSEER